MTYSNTYYSEHTTSINGKGKDIQDDDLLIVGRKANLSEEFMIQNINRIKKIVNKRLSKYIEKNQ